MLKTSEAKGFVVLEWRPFQAPSGDNLLVQGSHERRLVTIYYQTPPGLSLPLLFLSSFVCFFFSRSSQQRCPGRLECRQGASYQVFGISIFKRRLWAVFSQSRYPVAAFWYAAPGGTIQTSGTTPRARPRTGSSQRPVHIGAMALSSYIYIYIIRIYIYIYIYMVPTPQLSTHFLLVLCFFLFWHCVFLAFCS